MGARTMIMLEIERAPLQKQLAAGGLAPEAEAEIRQRLTEIAALLAPIPALALAAPDARGDMMAAIMARRVE